VCRGGMAQDDEDGGGMMKMGGEGGASFYLREYMSRRDPGA